MNRDGTDEEDAFQWEGDAALAARGLDDGRAARRRRPEGQPEPPDDGTDDDGTDDGTDDDDTTATRSPVVALLATGILAGLYVLLVIGWVRGVQALPLATSPSSEVGLQIAHIVDVATRVLAASVPVLWFGATLLLVHRPPVRIAVLGIGLFLMLPWPYLLTVGA